jgi:hypothetical protein
MTNNKEQQAIAAQLSRSGRWVICAEWGTEIGYVWVVLNHFATRHEAEAVLGDPEDRPEGVFLYYPAKPQPQPNVPDWDGEVPF